MGIDAPRIAKSPIELRAAALAAKIGIPVDEQQTLRELTDAITKALAKVPQLKQVPLDRAEKAAKKARVTIPFANQRPPQDARYPFSVLKTNAVHVWRQPRTRALDGIVRVDMGVEIPAACFTEKDWADHRVTHKKAVFVALMAAHLRDSVPDATVRFNTWDGDMASPVVLLRQTSRSATFEVRLLPLLAQGTLPVNRLAPGRAAVCRRGNDSAATPRYNSGILRDIFALETLDAVDRLFTEVAGFAGAAHLADLWLEQRALSDFAVVWRAIMAWLLEAGPEVTRRPLERHFDALTLFQQTAAFVGDCALLRGPEQLPGDPSPVYAMTPSGKPEDDGAFSAGAFAAARYDGAVLVDRTGHFNWLAAVPAARVAELQHEARISAALLQDARSRSDDSEAAQFALNAVFGTVVSGKKAAAAARFDYGATALVNLTPVRAFAENATVNSDYASYAQFIASFAGRLLRRGLSDRAALVSVRARALTQAWALDATSPAISASELELEIGIVLSETAAGAQDASWLITRGPPAEDSDAAGRFRQLWGDRAELRRFADGSIIECVVWNDALDVGAPSVLVRPAAVVAGVVELLLQRHAGLLSIVLNGMQCSRLLAAPATPPAGARFVGQDGRVLSSFGPLQGRIAKFVKALRALDGAGLPLAVKTVQAASSAGGYTSVFVPQPLVNLRAGACTPATAEVFELVLTFESSPRWPQERGALQTMKLALFLRIEELLRASPYGEEVADVFIHARDTRQPTDAPTAFMDVLTTEQLTFRLRICCEEERALLHRDWVRAPEDADVARAMELYWLQFDFMPRHVASVAAQCQENAWLGPTVRLCKRWLSAQLLAPQMPDVVVEAVCCHLAQSPGPFAPARNAQTGLVRFLQWAATTNFETELVDAPIGGSRLSPAQLDVARAHLAQVRRAFPRGQVAALFIATPLDLTGQAYGWHQPCRRALRRLRAVAQASLDKVAADDWTGVFTPDEPEKTYPVVLEISPRCVPRRRQLVSDSATMPEQPVSEYKNVRIAAAWRDARRLPPNMDPPELLVRDVLRNVPGALVFYDRYGGSALCVAPAAERAHSLEVHVWSVNGGQSVLAGSRNVLGRFLPAALAESDQTERERLHAWLRQLSRDGGSVNSSSSAASLRAQVLAIGRGVFLSE